MPNYNWAYIFPFHRFAFSTSLAPSDVVHRLRIACDPGTPTPDQWEFAPRRLGRSTGRYSRMDFDCWRQHRPFSPSIGQWVGVEMLAGYTVPG